MESNAADAVILPALTKEHHELYVTFRNQIIHEAGLINHRLTWNLSMQGFLFASYMFTAQKTAELKVNLLGRVQAEVFSNTLINVPGIRELRLAMMMIAIIGASVSLLVYVSVLAARSAQTEIRRRWCELHPEYQHNIPAGKTHTHGHHLPGITGGGISSTFYLGLWASLGLPLFFCFAWPVLFIVTN